MKNEELLRELNDSVKVYDKGKWIYSKSTDLTVRIKFIDYFYKFNDKIFISHSNKNHYYSDRWKNDIYFCKANECSVEQILTMIEASKEA